MRAAPRQGRYFPITEASFVSATKGWRLDDKVPLALRNPGRALADACAIATLRPGRDLVVFSLSLELDRELGARAASQALKALSPWKDERDSSVEGKTRAIVVYLQNSDTLRVVEIRARYKRRKFGAGEGLSSSRKPRVTSNTETQLAEIPIQTA